MTTRAMTARAVDRRRGGSGSADVSGDSVVGVGAFGVGLR